MKQAVREKIKKLSEMKAIAAELHSCGRKVVHCHGVFDLLHPGHVSHFNSAKAFADVLVVTITSDRFVKRGPDRPVFGEDIRLEMLANLQVVDFVAVVDEATAIPAIHAIRPDFYAKGPDYKRREDDVTGKIFEEEDAVHEVGGKLVCTEDVAFSSSRIINRYLSGYSASTFAYLKEMASRFVVEDIKRQLDRLSSKKVLVVGAARVGRNLRFKAGKLSPKENGALEGDANDDVLFASGSLAIANSLAGLCGYVEVVAPVGETRGYADSLKRCCDPRAALRLVEIVGYDYEEEIHFVSRQSGGELISLSRPGPQIVDCRKEIFSEFDKQPREFDLVIFSDLNFFSLSDVAPACSCKLAKVSAVKVDFVKDGRERKGRKDGAKVDFAWIDDLELDLSRNLQCRDIFSIKNCLLEEANCRVLMLPNRAEGSVWYLSADEIIEVPDLSSSRLGREVRDKLRFSFSAAFLALDLSLELSGFLAAAAASSLNLPSYSMEYVDFIKYLTRLLKV